MTTARRHCDALPLSVLVTTSLTLGLVPIVPEPHIHAPKRLAGLGAIRCPGRDAAVPGKAARSRHRL